LREVAPHLLQFNQKTIKKVDSHGLTPVALKKNELDNFSFGIHPRAHARGPLLISIELLVSFTIFARIGTICARCTGQVTSAYLSRIKRGNDL